MSRCVCACRCVWLCRCVCVSVCVVMLGCVRACGGLCARASTSVLDQVFSLSCKIIYFGQGFCPKYISLPTPISSYPRVSASPFPRESDCARGSTNPVPALASCRGLASAAPSTREPLSTKFPEMRFPAPNAECETFIGGLKRVFVLL